jgi:hypothetical protein
MKSSMKIDVDKSHKCMKRKLSFLNRAVLHSAVSSCQWFPLLNEKYFDATLENKYCSNPSHGLSCSFWII